MIDWKQPFLSKARCAALIQAAMFRMWEVSYMTILTCLFMGPTNGVLKPFVMACIISVLLDMTSALWRRLRRNRDV